MSQQETISKKIRYEIWNEYTVSQQTMMKQMGFKPYNLPKSNTPKALKQEKAYPTLKEYYIIAHIKCKLCGHRSHECYHMKAINYQGVGQPHLRAFACTEEEALKNGAKREIHSRPYCIVCKERLMEKTKEELVQLTIILSKKAACTRR